MTRDIWASWVLAAAMVLGILLTSAVSDSPYELAQHGLFGTTPAETIQSDAMSR
jgi:hypothetical protein